MNDIVNSFRNSTRNSMSLLQHALPLAALITFLPMITMTLPAEAVYAADSAEAKSLKKILESRKIMPPSYEIVVKETPSVVTLQTHERTISSDLDHDCSIDALLLARTVFAQRKKAARVMVYFYNSDNSSYRLIKITAGDVAAFASGNVSEDKLLQSIEVKGGKTGIIGANDRRIYGSFDGKGLSFLYPKKWKLSAQNNEGFYAQLSIPDLKSWGALLVRLQTTPSPVDQAGYDLTYFASIHGRVKSNQPIKIGNNVVAQQLLLERYDEKMKTTMLENCVYFGAPGQVYSLRLSCALSDFPSIKAGFDKVLETVRLAAASAQAHK